MSAKGDILIADDEQVARRAFRTLFEGEGYEVRTARDGEEALRKFSERRPDIVLLDVMMPRMNGISACAEIRKVDPLVPILFFTAMPSDVGAVRALGMGADDYIDKSKSPEELASRVAAALRRQRAHAAAAAEYRPGRIHVGKAVVDFSAMTIADGDAVSGMTRFESQLLRLLSSEPGRIFTYDEIMDAAHGSGYSGEDSAIHSAVYRLKAKLGASGALLVSERRIGYRLVR